MSAQVPLNPQLDTALDLVGTFVFGLSGASLGARKRFDVVGLVVLAQITAIGGGVLRDVVIGAQPPAAFGNVVYFLLPGAAAVLVFFFHPQLNRLNTAVLITDAGGLGLYCVAGTAKALAFGLAPVPAVVLGVVSAVGGGIMRDVLGGEIPIVFRRESELYLIPALLGATVVVLTVHFHVYGGAAASGSVCAATGLRLLALWRGWHAPGPRAIWPGGADDEGDEDGMPRA
jgi:uncharacterized membrane protein YeiH